MASTPRESKPSAAPPLLVLGLSRTGGTCEALLPSSARRAEEALLILELALARALAILGHERLYGLDDVANGSAEHADFWMRAVQRKLAGNSGFGKAEADVLLDGYDVSWAFGSLEAS